MTTFADLKTDYKLISAIAFWDYYKQKKYILKMSYSKNGHEAYYIKVKKSPQITKKEE